jgi:hypothetical protein
MIKNSIHVPEPSNPSAEDIFSSALGLISPDDTATLHGDPGSLVTYRSGQFGDIVLRLSAPETEDERRLFAQYVWNAGVLLAELIGLGHGGGGSSNHNNIISKESDSGMAMDWDVTGETVLELGAGESRVPSVHGMWKDFIRTMVDRHWISGDCECASRRSGSGDLRLSLGGNPCAS